jgi:hypothetical protein
MISSELAIIDRLVLHKVGNKTADEGVQFSKMALQIDDNINQLLINISFLPLRMRSITIFITMPAWS